MYNAKSVLISEIELHVIDVTLSIRIGVGEFLFTGKLKIAPCTHNSCRELGVYTTDVAQNIWFDCAVVVVVV